MTKGFDKMKGRKMLAMNVKAARALRDWSQEMLAEKAGISRGSVAGLESCQNSALADSVGAIGHAVGVPQHVLLMPPKDALPLLLAAAGLENG